MNKEQSHQDQELIAVVYSRDMSEANYYKSLLDDHEIPAVLKENEDREDDDGEKGGIAVMVPDEHLAEAQDIIEQSTAEDDYFSDDPDDLDDEDDEFADFQEEDL